MKRGDETSAEAAIFQAAELTRAELQVRGRSLRQSLPRRQLGEWKPSSDRRPPLDILRAQDVIRVPGLVPIRYGRMLESPFNFYRGSAAVMAADLASTPTTGINVQACGDAHGQNFGVYATPERRLVFDINDFDETLPGPWEYDLKRLATSIVLDVRDAGWSDSFAVDVVAATVRRYCEVLDELSTCTTLEVEYSTMDEHTFFGLHPSATRKAAKKVLAQASMRTNAQAARKWVRTVDGSPRFVDRPPLIEHLQPEQEERIRELIEHYRSTLQANRRHVLEQYRIRDVARKVVGVGSVGMRAFIVLMEGRGPDDLLILQVKQAVASVLGVHVGASRLGHQGQRVVNGQRMMQSASDPFLGWGSTADRDFYVRQLRDHKGPSDRSSKRPFYIVDCTTTGGTLARAHARSVDPGLLRGYTGRGNRLPDVLCRFAMLYAAQAEADYEQVRTDVERLGLPVERGV